MQNKTELPTSTDLINLYRSGSNQELLKDFERHLLDKFAECYLLQFGDAERLLQYPECREPKNMHRRSVKYLKK